MRTRATLTAASLLWLAAAGCGTRSTHGTDQASQQAAKTCGSACSRCSA